MIAGGSVKVPAARVGSQGIAGRRGVSVRARASAVRAAVERPPKVVLDELPIVYAYDHCPYCVRVRLGLGLKNVKHEVVFMANDDVKKPTGLIGKKIAPIFEIPDEKLIMGESMDIVKKIDAEEKYGSTGFFAGATDRKDIKAWMKSVKDLLRLLHRPRYMSASLPEFQQRDSRDYFVGGHPVPPYDKPEWKAEEFGQEAREEADAAAMAKTPELLPELNAALVELEKLIYSDSSCSEVGLGLDDIDLWSRLRSVTLVEGAEFQPKTLAYLNNLSEAGDVPLYFGMKC
ncbi:glutathione S-transferase [Chloropicon primus]|uniref:Glutathione S-transferase n=1 Tax=Chloropicon primus TaxID=1764295 RepID=A0A5B8MIG2_9CHLO|nr:glutathione S-transferase [Chloropicon primus]|eukprot:QDZ19854.1 glutathione S-transferase [Chloropicon primus]